MARYRAGGELLVLERTHDERRMALNATIDATLQKMARDTMTRRGLANTSRRCAACDARIRVGNVTRSSAGIPAPQINRRKRAPRTMGKRSERLQAWAAGQPRRCTILICAAPVPPRPGSVPPMASRCWDWVPVHLAADGTFVGAPAGAEMLQQLLVPARWHPRTLAKHPAWISTTSRPLPRWHRLPGLKRELDPHGRFWRTRWLGRPFADR